ncbi:type II/IV secretion system ATPase subunit [Methanospirillum stamsii]|uniref:Secretion system protein E n=1 Tax=Methanospirillum stamsii TaxID=1277351 RepID=A0A2V2MZD1_9EURY|nr:type II/IV secretion system ATPase subunit [Methanospirillum stamsii]PWR73312.1 secretion system protein E [Methanospirillum stamsii]
MGDAKISDDSNVPNKKSRSIKIKVPRFSLGKSAPKDKTDIQKKSIQLPFLKGPGIRKVPHVELEKKEVTENQDKTAEKGSGITRIKLPVLNKEEEITAREKDLQQTFKTEKESVDPGFERKLLRKLSVTQKRGFETYDMEKHRSLLEIKLPYPYESKQEYWVDPGLAKIIIANNLKSRLTEYLLFEPELTPFEYELLERIHEDLRDVLILTDEELGIERKKLLISKVIDLIDYYGIQLDKKSLFKIEYYLIRNYLGWGRINALMIDPLIEDISCDGDNVPIFLFHRKEQNIKTNISFDTNSLISLAITLAQRSGKHISSANPIVDATMPDGSRLQLTFGTEVTSRGTSFTIRKFRETPFTPVDLMDLHTFNVEMLVYFWLSIENNKSLVFIGGTASGKTTSLNAVSLFIPPLAKVISIEDTREVTLFHDNWIASITREIVAEGGGTQVDMFMLLKAAMRQRPEYILVGEVRGHEAQTLFQAMNTGHTTFSTMHAGSVDAAIHRLENEPLNVPRNMLQALNIMSIQKQIQMGPDRVRRCDEIVEIAGIDPATGNIMVNTVFEYDPVGDDFSYTGRSQVLGEIAAFHGWGPEKLVEEMDRRKKVLSAIWDQNIRDYMTFTKVIQAYYIDKDNVINNLDDLSIIVA